MLKPFISCVLLSLILLTPTYRADAQAPTAARTATPAAVAPTEAGRIKVSAGELAFSPDGKRLAAAADYKGPLRLLDAAAASDVKELATLEEDKTLYTSLSFSPDNKSLATVWISSDPAAVDLTVWDVATRKKRPLARRDPRWSAPKWARYSPDGRVLAAGFYSTILLFDPATGRTVATLAGHAQSTVIDGAYSGDGKTLATAGDEEKAVRLWDARTNQPRGVLRINGEEKISKIAVSKDASAVAVVQGRTVSVWDARTSKAKWSSNAHTDSVMAVSFSPDGKTLASASHDDTVRLWDAGSGKELAKVEPDAGMVQSALFSPDGSTLAVGTSSSTILYRLAPAPAPANANANGKATAAGPAKAATQPAARKPAAVVLSYTTKEHIWTPGQKPVRTVADKSGFCFLSGFSGRFAGYGEAALVESKDGWWTLDGRSQQEGSSARAVSVEALKPALFRPAVKEYEWSQGKEPVRMLRKKDGVCFLSTVSGNFRGGGEAVRVRLDDDGYWYLQGQSGQDELGAKAIGLEFANPGAYSVEVTEYTWSAADNAADKSAGKPIRLLRKEEGLCFLSGLSGAMEGGGEVVRLELADDGFWYLSAHSGQESLTVKAIAAKFHTGPTGG